MSEHYQLSAPGVVLAGAEHLLEDSRPCLAQAAPVVPLQIKPGRGKGIGGGETKCPGRVDPTELIGIGPQK